MNYPINLESLGVDSSANDLLFKKPCIVPYTSEQIQNLCTTVSPVDPVIPVKSYFIHVDGTRYPFGIRNTPIDNFCSTDANILINNTFYPKTEIQEIVFSDDYLSITTIDDNFLVNCPSLTDINLSGLSNVISIGINFLNSCVSLNTIDTSPLANVITIGNYFMVNCRTLNTINLTNLTQIDEIGDCFLMGCISLRNIDLSTFVNLTVIPHYFLHQCTSLETINLTGTQVNEIKDYFLSECTSLRTVYLQDARMLNAIGQEFLSNCTNLYLINLSRLINLSVIGYNFLLNCSNLTLVYIGTEDWSLKTIYGSPMLGVSNTSSNYIFSSVTQNFAVAFKSKIGANISNWSVGVY